MAEQTQQTDTVLPEYQEKYLKDLLATAQSVAGAGQEIPKYEDFVAALTPEQLKAIEIGAQGIGAYQPMLEAGAETLASGITTLGEGADFTRLGADQVTGATGAYDPQSYKAFMDPYQEEVVNKLQEDLERQRQVQAKGIAGAAAGRGAFGGSRETVAQTELGRNVSEVGGKLGAQVRSAGYKFAQDQAQKAFQDQMKRKLGAGQLFGQLGQGMGKLGAGIGGLGMQQAALGEAAQGLMGKDINMLLGLGGLKQQQDQAMLSGELQSFLAGQSQPFKEVGFLSDIFRGVPSSGTTITQTSTPDPSLISQIGGLATGIYGLSQADGGDFFRNSYFT
tara:strand:+ start:27 stop:1031 length:1005 start_codon:yes stop_codon:yes gene_type:complete